MAMDETLDVLLYLLSFWCFVFSKRFRAECISKFKGMKLPRRCVDIIGGLISTVVDFGFPVLILYWVFFTSL